VIFLSAAMKKEPEWLSGLPTQMITQSSRMHPQE